MEEFTTYYIYLRLGKGIFDGHQIIGHAGMFGVQPTKLSILKTLQFGDDDGDRLFPASELGEIVVVIQQNIDPI